MKTQSLLRLVSVAALTAASLSLGITPTHAQATYLITLNTSSLNTAPYTGPFVLDFQFVDGDGVLGMPLVNNLATISDFTGGTDFSATTVTIADGDPGAAPPTGEAQIGFTPGPSLSFLTNLTTNEDQYSPDAFSVAILDNGTEIPTEDAFGNSNGSFVTITEPFGSTGLDVETFDTSPASFTPTVTLVAPESSGGVTVVVGLAATGLLAACARRRRNAAPGRS